MAQMFLEGDSANLDRLLRWFVEHDAILVFKRDNRARQVTMSISAMLDRGVCTKTTRISEVRYQTARSVGGFLTRALEDTASAVAEMDEIHFNLPERIENE